MRTPRNKLPGGRADGLFPRDFDKTELKRGTRHELEHTKSIRIAQEIAMDHLAEDPYYYQKLARMEKNPGCQKNPVYNPTGTLPKAGRDLWERVYQASLIQYGGEESRAAKVAWMVVKTKYKKVGERWVARTDNPCLPCLMGLANPQRKRRRSGKTPDPGRTILLGELVELHWVSPKHGLVIDSYNPGEAKLLWSARQDALYGVPGLRLKNRSLRASEKDTARLFHRWADREADGAAMVSIPSPTLQESGVGVAVVYRSDKWVHRGGPTTDYIHFFEEDVYVAEGGKPPKLYLIQGGRLRVTPDGIAG